MSERNPFDLDPSQDLRNADKFSLVRDDPNAGYNNSVPAQYDNMQNPGGGYNGQINPGNGYGYNGQVNPGNGYGYNGQVNPGNGYGNNGRVNPGNGYGTSRADPSSGGGSAPPQGIYETMQKMEELRKSIYSRGVFTGIAIVALIMLMFFVVAGSRTRFRSSAIFFVIPVVTVIPLMVLLPGMAKKKKQLKQIYKETFVTQLLQQHFSNVMYDWNGGFSESQVRHSGLCRIGNRYHTEDYLSAVWNGVRFEQADVKIQYHTSSGRSSHTTTYFEGRMFVFDYTRKMTMPIQVHSKSFRYAGQPEYGMNLQKVELEDVAFNKRFVVKSTSPHDAFYVLTPQMMQRITYMEQTYGRITMVIVNGRLYVGIDNRLDAFDPQFSKPIEYLREKQRMLADVKVIEDLIQLLNCLP